MNAALPAPFRSAPMPVRAEWADYNGHLNMAYYHVLFDNALDGVLDLLGLGAGVACSTGVSVFTVQAQVHYLRELGIGDSVVVDTRLLDHDAKRLHYVQTMRHPAGSDAAVSENLVLCVNLATRRVMPWPDGIAARLSAAVAAHAGLPVPRQVGRRVGLARD